MTFHEERCRPSDPRSRPPVCDWCEEPYNRGDGRFDHPHPRLPSYIMTICERCAGPFMAEALAEGLMAVCAQQMECV